MFTEERISEMKLKLDQKLAKLEAENRVKKEGLDLLATVLESYEEDPDHLIWLGYGLTLNTNLYDVYKELRKLFSKAGFDPILPMDAYHVGGLSVLRIKAEENAAFVLEYNFKDVSLFRLKLYVDVNNIPDELTHNGTCKFEEVQDIFTTKQFVCKR